MCLSGIGGDSFSMYGYSFLFLQNALDYTWTGILFGPNTDHSCSTKTNLSREVKSGQSMPLESDPEMLMLHAKKEQSFASLNWLFTDFSVGKYKEVPENPSKEQGLGQALLNPLAVFLYCKGSAETESLCPKGVRNLSYTNCGSKSLGPHM